MNLKGGVLIIGSLLWEDHLKEQDSIRYNWRKEFLNLDQKIPVKLPIRYGRFSKKRQAYTMVYSMNCDNDINRGIGFLVPFKNIISDFEQLKEQVAQLSIAEGILKDKNQSFLDCTWGTPALLINRKKHFINHYPYPVMGYNHYPTFSSSVSKDLYSKWINHLGSFNNEDYCFEDEDIYIDKYRMLNIEWPTTIHNESLEHFDFLISIAVKPRHSFHKNAVSRYPTVSEIADYTNNDSSKYFYKNREKGITTFQDELIIDNSKSKKEDDLIPFCDDKNIWGFKDINHKTKIKPAYYDVKPFSNGLAAVSLKAKGKSLFYVDNLNKDEKKERGQCEEENWGFVNKEGEFKIKPCYGSVVIGFNNGKALIRRIGDSNSEIVMINSVGNLISHSHDVVLEIPAGDKAFYHYSNRRHITRVSEFNIYNLIYGESHERKSDCKDCEFYNDFFKNIMHISGKTISGRNFFITSYGVINMDDKFYDFNLNFLY